MFWKIIGALIGIWLLVSLAGFLLKGLFWLGVIGGVLFLGTTAYTALKGKENRKRLNS